MSGEAPPLKKKKLSGWQYGLLRKEKDEKTKKNECKLTQFFDSGIKQF